MSLQAPASRAFHRYYFSSTILRTNHGCHILKTCETYCPDPDLPRADSLSDPDPASHFIYPPLIHHIQSVADFPTLPDLIAYETGLPRKYIKELIAFGAVYLSVPSVSLSASKQKFSMKTSSTALTSGNALSQQRKLLDVDTPTNAMTRVSRVMKADTSVPAGSYCRVHVNPRRCREAVNGIIWKDR